MTDEQIKELALRIAYESGVTDCIDDEFLKRDEWHEPAVRFARLCIAHGLEMGAAEMEREFAGSVLAGDEAAHGLRSMAAEVRK